MCGSPTAAAPQAWARRALSCRTACSTAACERCSLTFSLPRGRLMLHKHDMHVCWPSSCGIICHCFNTSAPPPRSASQRCPQPHALGPCDAHACVHIMMRVLGTEEFACMQIMHADHACMGQPILATRSIAQASAINCVTVGQRVQRPYTPVLGGRGSGPMRTDGDPDQISCLAC